MPNGKPTHLDADDERMLLWVLRYDLGLKLMAEDE